MTPSIMDRQSTLQPASDVSETNLGLADLSETLINDGTSASSWQHRLASPDNYAGNSNDCQLTPGLFTFGNAIPLAARRTSAPFGSGSTIAGSSAICPMTAHRMGSSAESMDIEIVDDETNAVGGRSHQRTVISSLKQLPDDSSLDPTRSKSGSITIARPISFAFSGAPCRETARQQFGPASFPRVSFTSATDDAGTGSAPQIPTLCAMAEETTKLHESCKVRNERSLSHNKQFYKNTCSYGKCSACVQKDNDDQGRQRTRGPTSCVPVEKEVAKKIAAAAKEVSPTTAGARRKPRLLEVVASDRRKRFREDIHGPDKIETGGKIVPRSGSIEDTEPRLKRSHLSIIDQPLQVIWAHARCEYVPICPVLHVQYTMYSNCNYC